MSAILHFLVNNALMINFFEAPIIPGVAYCQGLVYIIHSLQNTSKQIQRNTYNWCLEHNHISLFLIYLYHIWLYCVCTNLDEVPFVYLYVCFISIVENAIENKSIDNNEANPYEWNARVQEKIPHTLNQWFAQGHAWWYLDFESVGSHDVYMLSNYNTICFDMSRDLK